MQFVGLHTLLCVCWEKKPIIYKCRPRRLRVDVIANLQLKQMCFQTKVEHFPPYARLFQYNCKLFSVHRGKVSCCNFFSVVVCVGSLCTLFHFKHTYHHFLHCHHHHRNHRDLDHLHLLKGNIRKTNKQTNKVNWIEIRFEQFFTNK